MPGAVQKARNGVHLNQVDTIAFGGGVRKVCWPDAYVVRLC